MDKLTEQEVGNLVGFLRTLMTAIATRRQTVLVITDPKDQPANAQGAARLQQLARIIEQQTGRQATVIEPIGNETAQVIIRRLFDRVDPAVSAKVSADHHGLYQRVAQDHPTLISEEARSPKYAERLRDCYPFHPRLMKTAEERLRMVWPRLSMARYRYIHRAFDRHVRLIHSPRAIAHVQVGANQFLQFGRISLDPAKDGYVVHLNAAVQQHEFEIAVTDGKHQIPPDRLKDHLGIELPPLEGLILPHLHRLSLTAKSCNRASGRDGA